MFVSRPVIRVDHRDREAAFAMAACISSIDTGFLRLPRNRPFSSFTERVAATMLNSRFPTSTNSIRSPTSTPRTVRTCTGMVICPFEVTVAALMSNPSQIMDSLHYSKEPGLGQFSPHSVTHIPAPPAESPYTVQTLSCRSPAPAQTGSSFPGKYGPTSSSQWSEQTSDHV